MLMQKKKKKKLALRQLMNKAKGGGVITQTRFQF